MSSVELARETDGPDLIRSLAEHGLRGELADGDRHLVVEVADCDEDELAHAIEDWLRELGLPLVPVRIDDCTYAVSPPAG